MAKKQEASRRKIFDFDPVGIGRRTDRLGPSNETYECQTHYRTPAAQQAETTMGLSTAERNRRKRERKKLAKAESKAQEEQNDPDKQQENDIHVEIEYVAEDLVDSSGGGKYDLLLEQLKRFQAKFAVVSNNSTEDIKGEVDSGLSGDDLGDFTEDEDGHGTGHFVLSKRKLREKLRPTVAALKRRVVRPDLVEAHDITAADPDFLIQLKAAPGSVPVPRHWGRKRKYLQGKVSGV